MATYDDFDGVYFTIQAIRTFHPEVAPEIEFLIVDNHSSGPAGEGIRQFKEHVPNCRYVPNRTNQGTASRDLVFRLAGTPYVLCVDSHVLLLPGTLRCLIDYLDAHPDCRDLLQGPLLYDDLASISTHFEPVWSAGMFGVWSTDERIRKKSAEPFEIPMQGLGIMACRRDAWPGLNPRFSGFGGEEGYLHEKFRRAGGRALCLPFLQWLHRFQRPGGVTYSNLWKDRIRNYLIGFYELGQDPEPAITHFREHLSTVLVNGFVDEVRAEIESPFFFFDAIYCINLESASERWASIQRRFELHGVAHRVQRFPAFATPELHHVGCALSHRAILQEVAQQGLQNVLVFEDDAILLDEMLYDFGRSVAELRDMDWELLYLGAHTWDAEPQAIANCEYLVRPTAAPTGTHAIAYNRSAFSRLLEELPDSESEMRDWIAVHAGIDQYLGRNLECLLTRPAVASRASIRTQEDPDWRQRSTASNSSPGARKSARRSLHSAVPLSGFGTSWR